MKVIRGMENAEYHAIRALSASRLKAFSRSPAHMRFDDESPKTTQALEFGTAFHTAVLEPMQFESQYVVAPDVDRRTTAGRAAYAEFLESAAGRKVVSYDDWIVITGMAREILLHPSAGELVAGRTETEVSLMWERDGIPCKARIDAINADWKAIVDVKTTDNASPGAFSRSIVNYGYHIQAAWYLDAAQAAGFDVECVVFVAAEKKGPYGVAAYRLDDAGIEVGRSRIAQLFPRYVNCVRENKWPGYSEDLQTISVPRWVIEQEEGL